MATLKTQLASSPPLDRWAVIGDARARAAIVGAVAAHTSAGGFRCTPDEASR